MVLKQKCFESGNEPSRVEPGISPMKGGYHCIFNYDHSVITPNYLHIFLSS